MSKVRKSILAFLLQSGVRFLDKWSRDRFIYFLYDLSIILSSFFRYLRTYYISITNFQYSNAID